MVDLAGVKDSFLYAVVFIAIFALLVTLGVSATPELFGESEEMEYYDMPDYFDVASIEDLATYHNITADNGGGYFSSDWGITEGFGHNFLFEASTVATEVKIANQHYYTWWVFPVGHHYMEWYSDDANQTDFGDEITELEIDSIREFDIDSLYYVSSFKVMCDHVQMFAKVGYNSTLYYNSTSAFLADDLHVVFAINWDELGTGLNAYNLIAQIMTFSRPDIHPALNAFVAIPLWASIGFMIVVIILAIVEALPFT